jgi:hypothetical protein
VVIEPFLFGAEDEHGPHRRCTGHVTGSSNDLVDCHSRATRVIWEEYGASFACDDPDHIGNATRIQPIGDFFVEIMAGLAQRALEARVE